MKILVTGGAGFIGSHLVDAFLKRGASVRIVDNFFSGFLENIAHVQKDIELLKGDIQDRTLVRKAVQNIDFVLHQAALKTVPESFQSPMAYNDVNIQGTLILLEESLKANVKKLVYASSSSVYGNQVQLPKRETDVPMPLSPYAISKLAAENYCQVFTAVYGLPTVSFRYFNVFGPRQPEKDGYSPVIPKFISCVLTKTSPPIYGDGKQSRDFTYVDNVTQANLLAIDRPEVTGVFNVGMGESHSLLSVIDILNNVHHTSVKPTFLPLQKGDVRHTLASLGKIQKELGFKSELSFQEGLMRTMQWIQNRKAVA